MTRAASAERRLAAAKPALEAFLAASAGAARIERAVPLTDGAIQENWRLEVAFDGGSLPGRQDLVLRTDAPSGVAASLTRPQEFAGRSVLGTPFYVMRAVGGVALGRRVVAETALGGDRDALAERLGAELELEILRVTAPARWQAA